jgi:hypothetical protein
MLIGSAAIANVRRIQRYLQARLQEEMRQNKVQDSQESAKHMLAPSFFVSTRSFFARFLRFKPDYLTDLSIALAQGASIIIVGKTQRRLNYE